MGRSANGTTVAACLARWLWYKASESGGVTWHIYSSVLPLSTDTSRTQDYDQKDSRESAMSARQVAVIPVTSGAVLLAAFEHGSRHALPTLFISCLPALDLTSAHLYYAHDGARRQTEGVQASTLRVRVSCYCG
jgi:hypothetical protein